MATLNSVSPQPFSPLGAGLSSGKPASAPLLNPRPNTPPAFRFPHSPIRSSNKLEPGRRRRAVAAAFTEDLELVPVPTSDGTDPLCGVVRMPSETAQEGEATGLAGGECQGFSSSPSTPGNAGGGGNGKPEDVEKLVDRSINAAIVLAAGSFAITKLLTIDHDYWHGWTFFEILRYAPQHNWSAYEGALKANPVLAKMMISGIVYSLGDWIAQCCQGKPLFEFDRARMFRSGLVGFCLHGSLSHYYYHFCEALFPFQDWWVVPAKVAFDQTLWAATWNSIYYAVVGILRFESPATLFGELKATFWPMLTAGWKLWPFAHLITYGVIPLEQRLLWVDTIELIWVTILSTYSNEKSEARISEAVVMDPQTQSSSSSLNE